MLRVVNEQGGLCVVKNKKNMKMKKNIVIFECMLNYSVAISYTICREEFFHFSHFPRESK